MSNGFYGDQFGMPWEQGFRSTPDMAPGGSQAWIGGAGRSASGGGGGGFFGGGGGWGTALRGIMSGVGAAMQTNEGWSGPSKAFGAGLSGSMAPYEADLAREEKHEDWLERLEADHENRLAREREKAERAADTMQRALKDQDDAAAAAKSQTTPASVPPTTPETSASTRAFDIISGLLPGAKAFDYDPKQGPSGFDPRVQKPGSRDPRGYSGSRGGIMRNGVLVQDPGGW